MLLWLLGLLHDPFSKFCGLSCVNRALFRRLHRTAVLSGSVTATCHASAVRCGAVCTVCASSHSFLGRVFLAKRIATRFVTIPLLIQKNTRYNGLMPGGGGRVSVIAYVPNSRLKRYSRKHTAGHIASTRNKHVITWRFYIGVLSILSSFLIIKP
jgi:hypothetical protein